MTGPLRPAVFIGSSTEGLEAARAIQVLLDRTCEAEIWSQGTFGPGSGTLESLVTAVDRFDFAILVVNPDDTTISRGEQKSVPRDNAIFELGLFMGALGRERTFMVFDRTRPPNLPSDLAGVTPATFEPHTSGNLDAALGAATTQIQRAVVRLGVREARRAQDLTSAADSVRSSGAQMDRLIRLLARSRKVELDVIASQFGSLIDSNRLAEMRKDLEDLMRALGPDTEED
jgi:Predicted nucleotide-binding protein containing TIR-like domain